MCDKYLKKTQKRKILIVDDDADFVSMNKSALELNGFDVRVAYSGKEGVDMVQADPPDLILLDMMMETWSEGTNVVEKLRSTKKTKGIPIILISAVNFRSRLGDVGEAEDILDVDGYLVKPFLPEKLMENINRVLKSRETKK